jgi:hypothetical protein
VGVAWDTPYLINFHYVSKHTNKPFRHSNSSHKKTSSSLENQIAKLRIK